MVRMDVKGLGKLDKKLDQYARAGRQAARKEVRRGLVNIQTDAKRHAPNSPLQPPTQRRSKSTGQLRSSIAVEVYDGGLSGATGTNVEHGPYQEFGTRTIPERPFLFPAFERERPKFVRRLGRAIKNAGRAAAK